MYVQFDVIDIIFTAQASTYSDGTFVCLSKFNDNNLAQGFVVITIRVCKTTYAKWKNLMTAVKTANYQNELLVM